MEMNSKNVKSGRKNRYPEAGIQNRSSSIQHPGPSIQYPESSIQNPVSSIQHPATSNRPFIVPIFLPHAGCPHHCAFCDQRSITGSNNISLTAEDIRTRVDEFLSYNHKQHKRVQIAFYGGNFLGQADETIEKMLAEATRFVLQGRVDSIRFSTRPDTIDQQRLELIRSFPVSTIELGVQSMHDDVLAASRRGHTRADTFGAAALLKEGGYEIGLQIMVGLPGDDEEKSMQTGHLIADLRPDFVRIYPTVVLNNSLLARWYLKGTYIPLSLERAVRQVADLFALFSSNGINTIRMGLQSTADLDNQSTILAGPHHPAFGQLVHSQIFLRAFEVNMSNITTHVDEIFIYINPVNISSMRGQKNSNVNAIMKEYNFSAVTIKGDSALGSQDLKINNEKPFSISENWNLLMKAKPSKTKK